jgi:hypothetical protein
MTPTDQQTQALINRAVSGAVTLLTSTPAEKRELNRTSRPALTSVAYSIYERNGSLTSGTLLIAVHGMSPCEIAAYAKELKSDLADAKVRHNILDLKLQASLRHG